MRAEAALPVLPLYGFLLVLARVSGALIFVPLPGVRQSPEMARIVLSLACTIILFPHWPSLEAVPAAGQLTGWLILEAATGVLVGLAVALFTEALLMSAQAIGLPAGYGYASIVDPQTQADSGVLLVLAQLVAGMLFFALGLDREVVSTIARSLEAMPPGAGPPRASAEVLVRLAGGVFSTGFRLAMPVLALLVMVDVALALLGRLNAQLQLLTLAFPVKMLVAVLMLAWTAALWPKIYGGYGRYALDIVGSLILRGGR